AAGFRRLVRRCAEPIRIDHGGVRAFGALARRDGKRTRTARMAAARTWGLRHVDEKRGSSATANRQAPRTWQRLEYRGMATTLVRIGTHVEPLKAEPPAGNGNGELAPARDRSARSALAGEVAAIRFRKRDAPARHAAGLRQCRGRLRRSAWQQRTDPAYAAHILASRAQRILPGLASAGSGLRHGPRCGGIRAQRIS